MLEGLKEDPKALSAFSLACFHWECLMQINGPKRQLAECWTLSFNFINGSHQNHKESYLY